MLQIEAANPGLCASVPLLSQIRSQRAALLRTLALIDQRTQRGADSLARLLEGAEPRQYFLTSQVRGQAPGTQACPAVPQGEVSLWVYHSG